MSAQLAAEASGADAAPAAPPPAARRRLPQNTLIGVIGLVIVMALAAVTYVQSRQYQVLAETTRAQDDYFTLSLFQLETEYLRLRGQWQLAVHGREPLDREALQLRYDIFVSRVGLLQGERVMRVMVDTRDLEATLARLRGFVAHADTFLGDKPTVPLDDAALAALEPELLALGEPIHALFLESSHHVASQVAQRNATVRSHNRMGIALTGLLSVTALVFAFITLRQMRQLHERRRGLERLAASLRQARRDAEAASHAKSVFLANMSHEIRTPFQGLMGMLSLLRDSGLDGRQLEHLRTATESADHLLVILNDILDMSKLESGSMTLAPESVDPLRLVGDVEALMRPQAMAKGLALRIEVDRGLPARLRADPTRVKQVLFNLMSNAIKFCDVGSVGLALRAAGETLEFSVTDTGIGMDEAMLARLFQRFTQGDERRSRRHGGTGLGLEISRNLARLMGGDIRVESMPGHGSTFTFTMPLEEAPVTEPAPLETAAAGDLARPLRVLVAEDHPVNRKYIAALLDRLGHAATFVENGAEAVDAVHASGPEAHFDLVLMDLHMPVMDGAEAAQRIRMLDGAASGVPIVALSADVFPETRERCRAAGMNDFLNKPVSLRQLGSLLHGLFGAPLPAAGPAMSAAANDAPAAADLIDASVIAGVLAVMTRDRLQALLETFFADAQAAGVRMRQALAQGLREPLRQAAHGVKGAALNLGLVALGDAAQQVQHGAAHGDDGDLERLLHRFDDLLAASRGSLQRTGLL